MGEDLSLVNFDYPGTRSLIVAGGLHACAVAVIEEVVEKKLVETDSVVCWGLDEDGQLGYGLEDYNRNNTRFPIDPVDEERLVFGSGSRIVDLAAGQAHTCAVVDDGSLYCWGLNDRGQLGQGNRDAWGDDNGEHATLLSPVSTRSRSETSTRARCWIRER